jgi:hypothetical protein
MALFPAIPNTDWTLVERAAEPSSTPQKVAMHTLLTLYYPALRAYVVSKWSIRQERAEEYLQEFLATKVVAENLIGQARKVRGRFRNFLRATLDDFIVSLIRRESAKKRSPGKFAPLASGDMVVDRGPNPRQAFEIAWARETPDTQNNRESPADKQRRDCEIICSPVIPIEFSLTTAYVEREEVFGQLSGIFQSFESAGYDAAEVEFRRHVNLFLVV